MIYKDLKSDNILLFSTDPRVVPNVKLTDYNIASEEMPGVEVGPVDGTLGFQAPEVLLRGTLSGKVSKMFVCPTSLSIPIPLFDTCSCLSLVCLFVPFCLSVMFVSVSTVEARNVNALARES